MRLSPALFYAGKNGIRFEISNPALPLGDPDELKQAFHRSIALFDEVFCAEDEIIMVTYVTSPPNSVFLQQKPLNVYRKYIKQKRLLYALKHEMIPEGVDEDPMSIHRFSLSCQKKDIYYQALLRAICYEDYAHPSTILKSEPQSGYEIYFLNVTKGLIYHLYDDRGCDILAVNKEGIQYLYEGYNGWILEDNRKEIDALFANV